MNAILRPRGNAVRSGEIVVATSTMGLVRWTVVVTLSDRERQIANVPNNYLG